MTTSHLLQITFNVPLLHLNCICKSFDGKDVTNRILKKLGKLFQANIDFFLLKKLPKTYHALFFLW